MEITQQVRDYSEKLGMDASSAIEEGMHEKSGEFAEQGGEIYS